MKTSFLKNTCAFCCTVRFQLPLFEKLTACMQITTRNDFFKFSKSKFQPVFTIKLPITLKLKYSNISFRKPVNRSVSSPRSQPKLGPKVPSRQLDLEKKSSRSSSLVRGTKKSTERKTDLDFDAEARLLWAKLNLDLGSHQRGQWNAIDPIWKHPTTNGTIYVGNQSAAESLALLNSVGITSVVNCTAGESKIPNFHEGSLRYYRFPVSQIIEVENIFKLLIFRSASGIHTFRAQILVF